MSRSVIRAARRALDACGGDAEEPGFELARRVLAERWVCPSTRDTLEAERNRLAQIGASLDDAAVPYQEIPGVIEDALAVAYERWAEATATLAELGVDVDAEYWSDAVGRA